MKTQQLGNTDLELTRVGFGTWAIGGGDWRFGWGPQDKSEAMAAITHAVELGINWVDTAPVYGNGSSEELVGKAPQADHRQAVRRHQVRAVDPRRRINWGEHQTPVHHCRV